MRLALPKSRRSPRMLNYRVVIWSAASLIFAGCATTTSQYPSTARTSDGAGLLSQPNPFAAQSALPFQAPPFDRIKDSDYQPALEAGMKEQIGEIEAIANQSRAASFDNTIVPMERSGGLLTRVSKAFNAVTG